MPQSLVINPSYQTSGTPQMTAQNGNPYGLNYVRSRSNTPPLPMPNSNYQIGSITTTPGLNMNVSPNYSPVKVTPNAQSGQNQDPNSQFSLLKQTKNPQLGALESQTTGNVANVEQQAAKTFNDYLTEAKQQQAQEAGQVAQDTANLNALPGQTQAQLDAINKNYAATEGNINAQYQDLNAKNAQTVQNEISQLNQRDQAYIDNTMAGAKMAADIGEANVNRFNAASGTPNSMGSGYAGAAAQVAANALIPAEQQLSQMQINQLTGFVAPAEQQLYQQNVGQAVNFSSQEAQQIASMQTGSAEQIAALRQATAGKGLQESMAFMQSLGIPIQVAQQVLSGSVSQIGGLTSADNANNFYGLSTNYNGTPLAMPGYNTPPVNPSYVGGGARGGNIQPNFPAPQAPGMNTGYGTTAAASPDPAAGGINWQAGGTAANPKGYQYGTPAYYAAVKAQSWQNYLSQTGQSYDPITGQFYSNTGAQVNPGYSASGTFPGDNNAYGDSGATVSTSQD